MRTFTFKPHQFDFHGDVITITTLKKEPASDIGAKLKQERMRIGMSQKDLADKVNLTPSFLSQLENNQVSPSLGTYLQLCRALGINPGQFLEQGEEKAEAAKDISAMANTVGGRVFYGIDEESVSDGSVVAGPICPLKDGTLDTRLEDVLIASGSTHLN